jgi:protein-disulfide isomerase
LSVPNSARRWILYLAPDKRFLVSSLWDLSVDPVEADTQTGAQLVQRADAQHAPARGPESAPATVVEFSDFQCSFCAAFAQTFQRYAKENPDKVRLIFRNFPLPEHGWAMGAARAGICIAQQSSAAFWQFHDFVFARQQGLTEESLTSAIEGFVASVPDLNRDLYARCMATSYPQARLEQDLAEARSLDIHATPTLFINGRRYGGLRDDSAFKSAVDLAVAAAPSKPAASQ